MRGSWILPTALGVTQTIGYGTLYYTLGVTAPALSAELAVPVERLFLWYSVALLAGGFCAPRFGRWLDRHGARRTMTLGSLGVAAALAAMAGVGDEMQFALVTVVAEVLGTFVLYDAAFAAIVRQRGEGARRAITHVTLIAGFASSIFWPVTSLLLEQIGWRHTYLLFAGLNLCICLPLHLLVLRGPPAVAAAASVTAVPGGALPAAGPRFWLLALSFAATAYVVGAIPAQMVPMLRGAGFGDAAIWLGSLMGPAQVAIRVVEATVLQRVSPLAVAAIAAAAPPLAVLLLLLGAPALAMGIVFALLFGFGSGLGSIVRGTLPLSLFGGQGYGEVLGRLASVRLLVAAFAPFLFALAAERLGTPMALWSAVAAGLLGLALLLPLRRR